MTSPLPFRPFLENLAPYTPGEQPEGKRFIKLNTNECPFPPFPLVIEEVARAARDLNLYPSPTCESLRRSLAGYHGVVPEQVFVGNGSDEVLRLLVHACVAPGGEIAVVDPSYSLYPVLSETFEGGTRRYPLDDRERLPASLFAGAEPLLFLPNPNPPIGTFYGRDEIARLCEARPRTLVVIDEAYVDFAPRDATPLLLRNPNLVISRTFSKSFSLAGLRLGYMLASEEIVSQIMKIKDSYNIGRLAQAAGAAALACADEMRSRCRTIVATRERVAVALRALGYRVPDSCGNFLFAIHPDARAHFLGLRECGILVRYFDTPLLCDGMRITIGTDHEMDALLEALPEVLAQPTDN